MTEQPRRVAILGSTGSIGCQTLEVIGWHPRRFRAAVLAAGSDSEAFRAQVWASRPALAVVSRVKDAEWLPDGTELAVGPAALVEAATRDDVELVVVATSGVVSLRPALAALQAGKTVAVANKEVLVSAGHLMLAAARSSGTRILPIDSEHSAIWQCLRGETGDECYDAVRRIVLTASGGAFRDWSLERLSEAKPADALRHPNWSMGPKITVDSATMMNKGLEVLEAAWLFDQPLDKIEIIIHRESVIHSMVEFIDGSVKAQLGTPDMRLPIQYALSHPERLATPTAPLDLLMVGRLSFEALDEQRFRCPGLAYQAGALGQTYPAVLNAANEEAVRLFLNGDLAFQALPDCIEDALDTHVPVRQPDLEAIEEVDGWARRRVRERVQVGRVSGIVPGPVSLKRGQRPAGKTGVAADWPDDRHQRRNRPKGTHS